jgi:serine/threonine protein phosphatase PrpC
VGDADVMRLTWEQATICSAFRDINQDSLLAFDDPELAFGLFVVADGIGAAEGGAQAAQRSTKIIHEHVIEGLPEIRSKTKQPQDILNNAFQKANQAVINLGDGNGASVTAALIDEQNVSIAHVGSTRAYLITDTKIEKLNRVHDLIHRMIEVEAFTWDTVESAVFRYAVYRTLGQSTALEIDFITLPIASAAYLLICSDGLLYRWNEPVVEEEIHQIVVNAPNLQQACDSLVKNTVTKRPEHRDTSVIVVQF